jgi:hypothetical protein
LLISSSIQGNASFVSEKERTRRNSKDQVSSGYGIYPRIALDDTTWRLG